MARAAVALALVAMLAFAVSSDALAVRQVFVWGLGNGVGGAAGAKAIRIALYNSWNKVNSNSVNGFWIGQQNDGLLFGSKDDTWGDIGGYTDWASVDIYKSFKVWEKNQPSYKALPVTTKKRLVSYL
ncbi:hypothetical protein OEZ86_008517 [Tetradesmus obliquus]|nr:hypothetical protein OEZ86_008517 [Tetradesmus obliquus]